MLLMFTVIGNDKYEKTNILFPMEFSFFHFNHTFNPLNLIAPPLKCQYLVNVPNITNQFNLCIKKYNFLYARAL